MRNGLLCVLLVFCWPLFAREAKIQRSSSKIIGEYVVTLKQGVVPVVETAHALNLQHRGVLRRIYQHALSGFAVELTEEQALALSTNPAVDVVEENAIGEPSTVATEATSQWPLDRIDDWSAPGYYSYRTTFSPARAYPVVIRVFDTGVVRLHDQFRYRAGVPPFWPAGDQYRVAMRGWDFVEPSGAPIGEQGGYGAVSDNCGGASGTHSHGTAVASIAAGLTYGAAKHAEIFPIRVFDCRTQTSLARVVAAIDETVAEASYGQTSVANFSFYFDSEPGQSALDTAIDRLIDRNIVVVAAANNHNANRCAYQSPARVPRAITVGATTNVPMDARAVVQPDPGPCPLDSIGRVTQCTAGSNFGPCLDVFAPGQNLTVATERAPAGAYVENRPATSYATGLVSGVVARFREQLPAATPADVLNYLRSQARNVVSNVPHTTPATTTLLVTVRPEAN